MELGCRLVGLSSGHPIGKLPMRVEYINPFIASVRNAFQTMLSSEAERGAPYLRTAAELDFCVSGVIGLSGDAMGTVVINMSKEVALGVASVLLMDQFTELTPDVIDAVGELTNVIAGAAKSKLEEFHLGVSLPNVITGGAHTIHFPRDVTPICVPFKTIWGPLVLEVGLTPVRQAVAG